MTSSPSAEEPRHTVVGQEAGEWRPVRIVGLDVDHLVDGSADDLPLNQPLWLEVTRFGCIVGVEFLTVASVEEARECIVDLRSRYGDAADPRPPTVPDADLPRASVIVPTIYENPLELCQTVESLLSLNYPDYDIIVVDNRPDPDAPPIAQLPGGERVRVVRETYPGVSAARNAGIGATDAEVIAFTDDDAVVDPSWLRVLGARFALSPEVGAVSGLVMPLELEHQPQLWFEEYYGGFSPSLRPELLSLAGRTRDDGLFPYAVGRFGAGCNMAFRRSAILQVGGYDVRLGGGTAARSGEDVAAAIELVLSGFTFAYEPAALVRHTHRRSNSEYYRQAFNYGAGMTALFCALIVSRPNQLLALARRVPAGIRHFMRPASSRSASRRPTYPRWTLVVHASGILFGPVGFARSAADARRRLRQARET